MLARKLGPLDVVTARALAPLPKLLEYVEPLVAKGAKALVKCDNKPAVTALREIAEGKVEFKEDVEQTVETYLHETRNRGKIPSANQ